MSKKQMVGFSGLPLAHQVTRTKWWNYALALGIASGIFVIAWLSWLFWGPCDGAVTSFVLLLIAYVSFIASLGLKNVNDEYYVVAPGEHVFWFFKNGNLERVCPGVWKRCEIFSLSNGDEIELMSRESQKNYKRHRMKIAIAGDNTFAVAAFVSWYLQYYESDDPQPTEAFLKYLTEVAACTDRPFQITLE